MGRRSDPGGPRPTLDEVFNELRSDPIVHYDADVLAALERTVSESDRAADEPTRGTPQEQLEPASVS